jgi:erythromycin esterase
LFLKYLLVCAVSIGAAPMAAGEQEAEAFVQWARTNAHELKTTEPGGDSADLAVLNEIIGAARVVGIGESVHATHEFSALQHRVVEYLVEEVGVTAVAVESGLAESKLIHDFALGGEAPPDLWSMGLAPYYSKWREMRDLVRWIRNYNVNLHCGEKIGFYGVDITGSYRTWMPALETVVDFLDSVDPDYATLVRETVQPSVLAVTATDEMPAYEVYGRLPEERRLELRLAIDGLVEHITLHRLEYLARSSADEFDWAHRAAVNLRQTELFYRTIVDRYLHPDRSRSGIDVRDWAMAENIAWILRREGPDGRVVVINHNTHIQKLPARTISGETDTTAMFLRSLVDVGYVAIGTAYGSGRRWDGYIGPGISQIEPSRGDSIEGLLGRVGLKAFVLDLNAAPRDGSIGRFMSEDIASRVDVRYGTTTLRAWDAVVYIDTISPGHRDVSSAGEKR